MREVVLKEGEYIRIRGRVTMYSPYKKKNGTWIGGSSWTDKNPLIMLGKCKHKPIKQERGKEMFGDGRYYFKGRVICSNCGRILKFGKNIKPEPTIEADSYRHCETQKDNDIDISINLKQEKQK